MNAGERHAFHFVVAWIAAGVLSCCTANQREAPVSVSPPAGPSSPAVIIETTAKKLAFEVEVADTPEERGFGLMFRKEMAANRGMLFVFETTEDHHFWMKNTLIALDMIFIGEDMTIAGIVHDAAPQSTHSRSIGKPSRYVLEINGGAAKSGGIVEGQRVSFRGVTAGR